MSSLTLTIGTQIDVEPRSSSQAPHISTGKLVTVQELLAQFRGDKQLFAMLRTTAGHIAACLGMSVEKLTIADLVGIVPEFRAYLKQNRYKRNAVNSYCNYA